MVSADDPGPLSERLVPIAISPLVKVMLVTPAANWITSPLDALVIASRKDPGPLSFPLVTVRVAAGISAALNRRALVTDARKERPMPPNLRLRLTENFFLINVFIFLRRVF